MHAYSTPAAPNSPREFRITLPQRSKNIFGLAILNRRMVTVPLLLTLALVVPLNTALGSTYGDASRCIEASALNWKGNFSNSNYFLTQHDTKYRYSQIFRNLCNVSVIFHSCSAVRRLEECNSIKLRARQVITRQWSVPINLTSGSSGRFISAHKGIKFWACHLDGCQAPDNSNEQKHQSEQGMSNKKLQQDQAISPDTKPTFPGRAESSADEVSCEIKFGESWLEEKKKECVHEWQKQCTALHLQVVQPMQVLDQLRGFRVRQNLYRDKAYSADDLTDARDEPFHVFEFGAADWMEVLDLFSLGRMEKHWSVLEEIDSPEQRESIAAARLIRTHCYDYANISYGETKVHYGFYSKIVRGDHAYFDKDFAKCEKLVKHRESAGEVICRFWFVDATHNTPSHYLETWDSNWLEGNSRCEQWARSHQSEEKHACKRQISTN